MFTANSMNCLLEMLGLALPGNGTVLAVSDERRELVRESAKHLMNLVKKQIKPRDIVTTEAIDDALMRLRKEFLTYLKSLLLPAIRCTMFMKQAVYQQSLMN